MLYKNLKKGERGATLMEFAIAATVFFTAVFAVLEFGRLLWVHNALRDATRRGARYAVTRKNDTASVDAVKKMVVYGDPNASVATARPIINGLTINDVAVEHRNFDGIRLSARVTVSITNYQFRFAVPLVGTTINLATTTLPGYKTSMTGESAGFVPCDIPSATPHAPCGIVPIL